MGLHGKPAARSVSLFEESPSRADACQHAERPALSYTGSHSGEIAMPTQRHEVTQPHVATLLARVASGEGAGPEIRRAVGWQAAGGRGLLASHCGC